MPLAPVDPALHRMPQPVGHRVEGRRPAALAALARRWAACRPSLGWCSRSCDGVGRPGWPGSCRPCRPAPGRAACGAAPGPGAGPGCRQGPPQTAGCRRAGRRSPRSTAAAGHPRPPGAACSSARPGSARGMLLGLVSTRPVLRVADPPIAGARGVLMALATVESTLTSQVIKPLTSAWACNRVRIRCQVPSRCQRRNSP